jgi:hypothetical protein
MLVVKKHFEAHEEVQLSTRELTSLSAAKWGRGPG